MAFTDSFTGTAGTNLTTYSTSWSMCGDSVVLGGGGGSGNAVQIASSNAGVRDQNVGNNTWFGCPDQGTGANYAQYIKLKYGNVTPNNQLRGVLYLDPVLQDGIIFSITTANVGLLRYIIGYTATTILTTSTTINVGDTVHIYAVSTAVSSFTCHVLINGVEDGASPNTTGAVAGLGGTTRQGFNVLSGQAVLDPWISTFEAGSGTGLTGGGGSTRIRAVNFYSMMRNQ